MSTFTKQEKWILKKTAELKRNKGMHSISLGDICVAFLDNEYIHIHLHRELNIYDIEFMLNLDNYNPIKGNEEINKKQEKIEQRIIDSVFLLKYLKENRLLFEISANNSNDEFDVIRSNYNKDRHFRRNSNFDKATDKFIVDLFVNKQYFIRQEFIDFVDKGFKTIENRHFRKGQISTWTGIIIAFLIGLCSILLNIITEKRTTETSKNQINYVDSCFNELKKIHAKKLTNDNLFLDSIHNKLNVLIDKTEKNKPMREVNAFIINYPKENETGKE